MFPIIILAGGLATRLRPITEKIPKSLIEINGEPFVYHQLDLLEQHILSKYIPSDKIKHKSFLIMQSLKLGYFRIFHSKENTEIQTQNKTGFILKISGIWENATEYGVSYKIMDACHHMN